MNEKIKNHLIAYAKKEGWEIDENDPKELMEIITEANSIYKENLGSHRWYDDELNIVNVDGMLIGYNGFHITGDNSMYDMGLEYDLDQVCEVEPKERIQVYYIKKK